MVYESPLNHELPPLILRHEEIRNVSIAIIKLGYLICFQEGKDRILSLSSKADHFYLFCLFGVVPFSRFKTF